MCVCVCVKQEIDSGRRAKEGICVNFLTGGLQELDPCPNLNPKSPRQHNSIRVEIVLCRLRRNGWEKSGTPSKRNENARSSKSGKWWWTVKCAVVLRAGWKDKYLFERIVGCPMFLKCTLLFFSSIANGKIYVLSYMMCFVLSKENGHFIKQNSITCTS